MDSIKMIVLIFAIQRQCFATLSKFFDREDRLEILTGEWGTILHNCKSTTGNHVGIWGDSASSIQWTTKSLKNVPRILVTNAQLGGHFSPHTHWRNKLSAYVIITSSENKLKSHIEGLKKTIWWNPWQLHILVDERSVEIGCQNANSFLRAAWNESLLSATFLCISPKNTFKMYTYNPYTAEAPKPWRKVSSFLTTEDKHPWTLFERNFVPGKTTCENLTFDKTRTLGGYPVRAIGLFSRPDFRVSYKNGLAIIKGRDSVIGATLLNKLNATLALTIDTNSSSLYALVPLVQSGDYDILLNALLIYYKVDVSILYPHVSSGLRILTKHPTEQSAFINILIYMNPSFLTGSVLVAIVTIIILGRVIGRGYEYAIMEILRMLTSNSILRFPRDNPMRIYMFTVMFLYMITNWCFQSKLSSLLTSPSTKLRVNNAADLKASGYTIYTYKSYKRYIFDEELRARTIGIDHWDCSKYVMKYENAACVADGPSLLPVANKTNLHLSFQRLMESFFSYVVRPNWPPHHRACEILSRLYQNGMTGYLFEKKENRYQNKVLKPKIKTQTDFSKMKLKNLMFIFHFLLVGLGLSIVTFVFEVWIERRRRQRMRMRRAGIILPFVP